MPLDAAPDLRSPRQAVENLVGKVRQVVDGKAYGLDKEGELIGSALRASFKGKVVDLLVRTGFAKPGNLGGRFAAALVGRDNFSLIANARANPGGMTRDTVKHAIECLSRTERGLVEDDFDLSAVVGSEIDSKLKAATPLRELVPKDNQGAGRLLEMHEALHEVVIPQRLEARQRVVDSVEQGQPTAAMQGEHIAAWRDDVAADGAPVVEQRKIHPDELRAAARAIQDAGLATGAGELGADGNRALGIHTTSGRVQSANNRAASILLEFNRACRHVRAQTPAGEDPTARVESFRARYVGVLEGEFNRLDAEDGSRVRVDGQMALPVRNAGAGEETLRSIPQEPYRAKEPVRPTANESANQAVPEEFHKEVRDALEEFDDTLSGLDRMSQGNQAPGKVAFGGETRQVFKMGAAMGDGAHIDEPRPAFPGEAPIRTGNVAANAGAILEEIEALHDDAFTSGNIHQLVGFAKDIGRVFDHPEVNGAIKEKAADLAGHPDFAQHLDSISVVLPILEKSKTTPVGANAIELVGPVMRHVAETELAKARNILERPDAAENAEYFRSFEDAYQMDVAEQFGAEGDHQEARRTPVIQSDTGMAYDGRAEALKEAGAVVKTAQKVLSTLDSVETFLRDDVIFEDPD